ncbi:MAG: phosphotransferase, partial [Vicinamibacterales bacterium]
MTADPAGRAGATAWLVEDLPRIAATWLPAQRWFGGKSRTIRAVRTEEVVWLPGDGIGSALVVLDVAYADGPTGGRQDGDCYAVFITFVDTPHDQVIGTLPETPTRHAVDGVTHPGALAALLRGLVTQQPCQGMFGGEIRYADGTGDARQLLAGAAPPAVAPVGAEQSNTSVRVGTAHVFKLFRRLEAGEHPQLEFGRFLARVGFRSAPPLEGSLVFRARTGQVHALGALEGWIANQGDGWSYVTDQLRRAAGEIGHARALAPQMHALGETTATFHLALASDASVPAFAPEPVTPSDGRQALAHLVGQAERTWRLVEQQRHQWTGRDADAADAFREAIRSALPGLGSERDLPGAFHRIRVHGDYHLGQTLKTESGFVLIDFEGEPTRPLVERRDKQCALKDVAGMLRSLDYAWAAAAGTGPSAGAQAVVSLAEARAAFLHGYHARARSGGATFLPPDAGAERWTALFELEKALYEVAYEANNRPDWVGIPLGAAARL